MDLNKVKEKLSKLSHRDLEDLYQAVLEEKSSRPVYMSNTTHTPQEQCRVLADQFSAAWIHGF
jgi:hypothetical protein